MARFPSRGKRMERLAACLIFALFAVFPALASAVGNHALIIGIARYDPKTGATPLPGVPHDLQSAARIAGAVGVPPSNIRVLTDSFATKAAIVSELKQLTSRVSEGGRAMIFFSGHGTRWFDPNVKGCVEGLFTYEGGVIVNSEFAELVKTLGDKVDKLIIMFDACHSEGVTSASRTRSASGELSPKFFVRTNDSAESCSRPANQRTRSLFNEARGLGIQAENIIHISSSRPDEVSFDEPGRGGLATQAIRDCMFGDAKDLDRSGGITLNEIEICARGKIRDRLANHPSLLPHHPTIIGQRNLLAFSQQRQAEERLARERDEARREAERENQRREKERIHREQERLAQEREEARLAAERESQRREQERIAREQERLAREREEARAATERESQRREQERIAREQQLLIAEQERLAREMREREQAELEQARIKLAQERLAAERRETERQEELRRQELARQRAEELIQEQARLAQAARDERERHEAAERERERQRLEVARREQERIESERREAERLALQRAREEAQAREESEKLRLAQERQKQEAEARRLAELARDQAERVAQEPQQAEPPPSNPPLGPLATLQNILDQRDVRRQVEVKLQKSRLRIEVDELALRVTSQEDGYLYLIHIEPDLQTFTLLFPNSLQSDNKVQAKRPVSLPRLDSKLVSAGPAGTGRVLAIVSGTPRDIRLIPPVAAPTPFGQVLTDMDGRARLIQFAVGSGGAFGAAMVEVEEYR